MYPNRNYFNNKYSAINNQQTGTANPNTSFFPRPVPQNGQPLHNPYIYPTHQFGVAFDYRNPPPPIPQMNSQSTFLPLPPPPAPPSQYQLQLQGLFQPPPFPANRQQLTSNFAGRNVIFSSSSSTYSSVSQNPNQIVNPPPAKITSTTIPNSQLILPIPPIVPPPKNNTAPNVPISDELHISTSNLSEAISEDHNNPLGKRTVINEQALAKLAKNNQQIQNETTPPPCKEKDQSQQNEPAMEAEQPTQNGGDPILAATTTESSPESVQLGGEQEEEDEEIVENPEMAKNWRMLMIFSGRLQNDILPLNSERPQNAEGIEFPFPESMSKWQFSNSQQQSPDDMDISDESEGGLSPMEGTSQQAARRGNEQISARAKSLPPPPPPPPILNQQQNRGYVLPNGRTWVRHHPPPPPTAAEGEQQKSAHSLVNKLSTNGKNGKQAANNPAIAKRHAAPPHNPMQKRFANNTLLIMKNGKRLKGGTRECYQFAETGICHNGIFCIYEHNGNMEHTKQRVCKRLLRGLCHETDDNCFGGLHSPLLPHQMPICDFYLRMVCCKGKEACPFLHVRHTPRTEPCIDFNRGNCQRGIMCEAPHRYIYHLIKQKSSDPKQVVRAKATTSPTQQQSASTTNPQQNVRFHMNMEMATNSAANNLESPASPSPPLTPISPLQWIDE